MGRQADNAQSGFSQIRRKGNDHLCPDFAAVSDSVETWEHYQFFEDGQKTKDFAALADALKSLRATGEITVIISHSREVLPPPGVTGCP